MSLRFYLSGWPREDAREFVRYRGLDEVTGEVVAGMAKQSMKEQCDINRIMARYLKSGNVDHLAKHGGSYGDVEPQTFHEAMNVVAKAEEMFADLPSELRKRFANEPGQFLAYVQNPANLPEMRKLGLAKAPPASPSAPSGAPGGAIAPAGAPSGGSGGAAPGAPAGAATQ